MTGVAATSLISVVIPTHAGRTSIRACVESLLRQGEDGIEIIIVTDGEGSTTREVLHALDDPRLRVFEKAQEGANAARNYGLARARHRWVAFVDDDDVPRSDWLTTWQQIIDESAIAATAGLALWREGKLELEKHCRLSLDDPTMGASTLMAGAFIIRRELLRAVGGYDTAIPFGENQDLGLRIIDHILSHGIKGEVVASDSVILDVYVEEAKSRARRHGDAQAKSVRVFLRRFPDRVMADPQAVEAYSRILARAAREGGDRRGAFAHAIHAVRCNPRNLANYRSLVGALLAGGPATMTR